MDLIFNYINDSGHGEIVFQHQNYIYFVGQTRDDVFYFQRQLYSDYLNNKDKWEEADWKQVENIFKFFRR